MPEARRPLSPHLSIYRWPLTMTVSILHRLSGVALCAGFVGLALWLIAAGSDTQSYSRVAALIDSLAGRAMLAAWSFAFFFHLANGVRHLFWDAGYGFEKSQANASAWIVIVLTVALTLGYWLTFQGA
ncbi:MAG TPA: succinate dehydrogenase, cytochrome b556 subunit [Woeseiaceae bacterium]|jgi:succinate dehydrogenase / fumarate reductase cytochrome b subunit|nr:succinate dehydrogenase, cytochrome b556 subunit [Woeseiaceae bacterium]